MPTLGESLSARGVSPLQLKLKRAASRAAANNPDINPLASGVAYTNNSALGTGVSRTLSVPSNLAKLTFRGGVPTVNSNGRIVLPVSTVAPATDGGLAGTLPATPGYNGAGWEFGFVTAAPLFEVRAGGNPAHDYRWRVDDQYISKAPAKYVGAYNRFDFSGVVKDRMIVLEGMASGEMTSIHLPDATYDIAPLPSIGERVLDICTGDSYALNQNAGAQFMSWATLTSRRTGGTDCRVTAIGGTGYFANRGGGSKTLRGQVGDWFTVNTDITGAQVDRIFVGSGYNDYTYGATPALAAQLTAEALLTFQAMRAACPNAVIFIFGPWPGIRNNDAQSLAVEDAIAAAFTQWADPNSVFTRIIGATVKWMTGTGYVGATNTSGDTDYLMSNDQVHPTLLGQDRLARRVEAAYRSWLSSL